MPNSKNCICVLILLTILTLSMYGTTYGQNDTMLIRILNLENDSLRIEELNKSAESYRRTDLVKSWKLASVQDSLVQLVDKPIWTAQTRYLYGNLFYQENKYELAIQELVMAAELYQNNDPENRKIAGVYNTIAAIYSEREDHEKAVEYYQNALEIFKLKKDSLWIGLTYLNASVPYLRLEDFDKAETLLLRSDSILDKPGWQEYRGYTCLNLADTYQQQEKYLKANQYAKLALEYISIDRDPKIHSGGHLILGRSYQHKGQYIKAIREFRIGLRIAEDAQYKNHVLEASEGLWQAFESSGDRDLAFPHMKTYISLKDSLRKEDEDKRMLDVLKKFEFEKKETEVTLLKEVALVNEEKIGQQRIALGGSILGLGLLSFLLYRIFDQKKGIEERNEIINNALKEKDILLREIHHRVKNNLQVISSLLGIQGRSIRDQKAKDALQEGRNRVQSMSLIHQNLYKKDNLTGIEMKPYVEKLATNLLQTYHVEEGNIEVYSDVDDISLDVETVVPIGLIINELISNSLKYAFPNGQNGTIRIVLAEHENTLMLSVSDDGVGLNPDQLQSKADSFGHSLILAFKSKLEATINISGDNGTEVKMKIRNYKKVA